MAKQYQNDLQFTLNKKVKQIVSTLPDFAGKFFKNLQNKGMSERTRLGYAYDIKRFFDYLTNSSGFRNIDLNACKASDVLDVLTYDDIQEYLDTLNTYIVKDENGEEKQRLTSPSLKARKISSLRSFYRFYFKIGEIKNNLADLMDLPKIPENKIFVMDKEQVQRILSAISDTTDMSDSEIKKHNRFIKRDYAIMMLFLGTGIRVSELVGVDLSDIDFYNASLFITRKGGDEDKVYFGPEVQDALEDYINTDRNILLAGKNNPALFVSARHKRMKVRSIEVMIKKYAQKADLNLKITPHALRRTYGTNLYEETGDIYLVADALHHSNIQTTKKHYAKIGEDHKRIAAKKSSSLFK